MRWSIRTLTGAGILVALLNLDTGPDFLVALALAGADWLVERSLFRFAVMHVTPLPDFDYDAAQWKSMAYLFDGPPPSGTPLVVGFVFGDAAYGTKFFELLRAWNLGEDEDRTDNIHFSIIIDEDHYWVYLYPAMRRKPVRASWRSVRDRARRAGKDREPFLMIMSLVICHEFSTTEGFGVGYLADRYKHGEPIDLLPLVEHPGHNPAAVPGVRPIRKFRLRIKARADLAPDDFEATHLRKIGR